MKTISRVIILAGAMLLASPFAKGETNSIPWRLQTYSLNAKAMSVRELFETFGVAQGVPVLMSDAVTGKMSGVFKDVPAVDFVDKVATVNNLVWYYDGASIYVYSSAETQTALIDLRYMKAGEVRSMLAELGIEDRRYPLKTAQKDELIMVSGPPRYVTLVSEMIARADRLREQRTFNEVEVRLFPLKYTWADNVSFSVSTSESTLPLKGIAQLLEEMTKVDAGDRSREGTNELDRAEIERGRMGLQYRPTIVPENRMNAVMVRDVATRMPMYERLIKQLDRPTKLLEIVITTIELSKNDALDWQLSLSAHGTARANSQHSHEGGAGQNIDNLMGPTSLEGKGLSAAYSYIGKNFQLGASISALKAKGKTRSISRTALLTMNNLAASINDTQSYNARVTGERVANIQSVSAGTTFSVKPRAVKTQETNDHHRVWMTLQVQDGGFESTVVDGMPMTRTTTLTTQTVMDEGESLVLAGYMRDVEGESGWGIPYLRDIPWIGWLFGGVSKSTETVQRFFVLTPHVIEITGPDTPFDQLERHRNVNDIEMIEERADELDDARRLRKLERENAHEIREQKYQIKADRREAELDRDRDRRELEKRRKDDQLERDVKRWTLQQRVDEKHYEKEKKAADAKAEKQNRPLEKEAARK